MLLSKTRHFFRLLGDVLRQAVANKNLTPSVKILIFLGVYYTVTYLTVYCLSVYFNLAKQFQLEISNISTTTRLEMNRYHVRDVTNMFAIPLSRTSS